MCVCVCVCVCVCERTCVYVCIELMGRVFTNGSGDCGSIPGRVILKIQKIVLNTSLLNTQQYKVCIKGKVEQSREEVAASSTPQCSSYSKGSLWVTLDHDRNLSFYLYMYGNPTDYLLKKALIVMQK